MRAILALIFSLLATAASAQPGPGPTQPWIQNGPLIYYPGGSVNAGAPLNNTGAGTFNASDGYYLNNSLVQSVTATDAPLNYSAGTLSLNINSSLTVDGSNNLGINLSHANSWSASQTFSDGATFSAAITYGGVTLSNSVTGTGAMVLSSGSTIANPTFTGSVSAAGLITNTDLAYDYVYVNGVPCTLGVASPGCSITATAANVTVGGGSPTGVINGTPGDILAVGSGPSLTQIAVTGSGSVVLATAPTIAGETVSGTANFIGTFEIGGQAETFPASGLIVGTTDIQSLTNKSIAGSEINSGTVGAAYLPIATSAAQGIVQGDGSTLTINTGVISCTTMTASQIGCGYPDNSTIVVVSGKLTAVSAASASITVGVTTVGSATASNYLLGTGTVSGGSGTLTNYALGTGLSVSGGAINTPWTISGSTQSNNINLSALNYSAPGTDSVLNSLDTEVRSTQFGFICDGSTDNTTAFTNAIAEAIATTGVLHFMRDANNGYQCEWKSQIVVTAPDSNHYRLRVNIDKSVQMLFNGSTGGLACSGEGGTRMTCDIRGGYWYPYTGGSGFAFMCLAGEHCEFDDFDYNTYGTTSNTANITLFDNVFSGRMSNWTAWGCANGVLLRNASNAIKITDFDLEHCTTEGIYSADNTITASTNASTSSSSAVLNFATAPGAMVGQIVTNNTHPLSITGGTSVASVSGMTVTMSADAASTISSGDSITFTNANSSANELNNGYIEQVSNSIDVTEAGDYAWLGANIFINQGDYLGTGSYDLHVIGSLYGFSNVQIVGSSSETNIHNDSVASQFWNIAGTNDSASSDLFFRNHTTAQASSFCGSYIGTLPTGGFWGDTSTDQNNPLPCAQANVNGNVLTYTVATLPVCNAARNGQRAIVTNSGAPGYHAQVASGGSIVMPGSCDGPAGFFRYQ